MSHHESPVVRHFFEKGQPLVFEKGEVIVGNEDIPNGIYYIDSGYVKTYSISDNGDEYLHAILAHGELFPIIWAYLGSKPDHLFYEAITTSTVWRISRESFNHYIQLDMKLSYEMSLQLARQCSIYIDRIDNLEYKKASERIAYYLLSLASRFGSRNDDNEMVIDAPVTHEIFGNSINLARESVSREMERLKEEDVIAQYNHTILIKDLSALTERLSRPANFENWGLPVG